MDNVEHLLESHPTDSINTSSMDSGEQSTISIIAEAEPDFVKPPSISKLNNKTSRIMMN